MPEGNAAIEFIRSGGASLPDVPDPPPTDAVA
jgi:hypothetical protein